MQFAASAELSGTPPELLSLGKAPEPEVEDHVDSEHEHSRGELPEHALHGTACVVERFPGDRPAVHLLDPLVRAQAQGRPLGFDRPRGGRLPADRT
jgi:hypothetical protein